MDDVYLINDFLLQCLDESASISFDPGSFTGQGTPPLDSNEEKKQATTPTQIPDNIGPYSPIRVLGRGGQGAVYLCQDTRLKREVAVKLLSHPSLASPDSVRRFRREAEIAAGLSHPNICPVYDVGTVEGVPFIAMKYIPGASLKSVIDEARSLRATSDSAAEGALCGTSANSARATALTLAKIARAAHAAHERGIIHRDIKPGNVVISTDGTPVLMDFGVASIVTPDETAITGGDGIGTPLYMAPEQFSGGKPTPLSDVWSLGVTIYESLTTRRPFEAPTIEALSRRIIDTEPLPPRTLAANITRDLDVVVRTCLAKDPTHRYASAAALADDLEAFADNRAVKARPVGIMRRSVRWARRRPRTAASLSLMTVLAALTVGLGGYLLAKSSDIQEAERRRKELDRDLVVTEAIRLVMDSNSAKVNENRGRATKIIKGVLQEDPGDEYAETVLVLVTGDLSTSVGGVRDRLEKVRDSLSSAKPLSIESEADNFAAAILLLGVSEANLARTSYYRAKAHLAQAILLSPRPRFLYLMLALRIEVKIDNAREALGILEAIRLHWQQLDPETLVLFAGMMEQVGNTAQAEELLIEAMSLDPRAKTLDFLEGVLANQGRFDEAVKVNEERRRRFGEDDGGRLLRRAETLVAARRSREAAQALDALLSNLNSFDEPHQTNLVAVAAWLYRDLGDSRRTVELFSELVAKNPTDYRLKCDFAIAIANSSAISSNEFANREKAIVLLKEVVRANPLFALAYQQLGANLYLLGAKVEGTRYLKQAVDTDPMNPKSRLLLAGFLAENHQIDEAREHLNRWFLLKGLTPAPGVEGWEELQWIEEADEAARMLRDLKSNRSIPVDPDDMVRMATAARSADEYAIASTLLSAAFQKKPSLMSEGDNLYWAACVAIRAGLGPGAEPSESEEHKKIRAKLRRQGRLWLRRVLDDRAERYRSGRASRSLALSIRRALKYELLAPLVRGEGLERLPEKERQLFLSIKRDAESLLEQIERDLPEALKNLPELPAKTTQDPTRQ